MSKVPTPSPADPVLIEEAAQWLARMQSPEFTAADAQELELWRNLSEAHRHVWTQAERLKGMFGALPPAVAMSVLDRPKQAGARRRLLKMVGLLVAAPSVGVLAYQAPSRRSWFADYRTSPGERHTVRLHNGAQVELNTATSINIETSLSGLALQLISGEVLLQAGQDANSSDPACIISTPQGLIHTVDGQVLVRCENDMTQTTVLEGSARVTPTVGGTPINLSPGQQLILTAAGARRVQRAPEGIDGWLYGVLFANRMPLGRFIEEVARYRSGILRCDPVVAGLEVSGTYQLSNTGEILHLLERSLPIKVNTRTKYWVTVTAG